VKNRPLTPARYFLGVDKHQDKEDHKDDPVLAELNGFIGALTEDEQIDLVALTWLGRGDGTIEDWQAL
jgi:hypothetical protein